MRSYFRRTDCRYYELTKIKGGYSCELVRVKFRFETIFLASLLIYNKNTLKILFNSLHIIFITV